MPIGVAELEAAGLYDPALPGAAERLALLQWLADQGATLDELVRAARDGAFTALAADLARRGDPRFTLAELASHSGVSVERIAELRAVAGLPPVGDDEAVLVEDDAIVVTDLEAGARLFGKEPLRRLIQTLGTSLARIAEAAVAMSVEYLELPIQAAGGDELAMIQARFGAVRSGRALGAAVTRLFRAHLEAAGRRVREAMPPGGRTGSLSIGFVDLVGFTTLARRVHPEALADIIDRFEETAHDVAASCGGRVVKFVGDEVMFVASARRAACDVALTLVERFAGDDAVAPRGGLAHGDVLVRGGDYYGPIVNLAARLAEQAVPREILVSEGVASDPQPGGVRFEPAGRRILKGFDEPVRVFSATRSPS